MAILHNNVVPALPTGGYTIDQSLRFEDGSSAYLSRTPASAGNRKTWTWSGWVKRGNLSGGARKVVSGAINGSAFTYIEFTTGDSLRIAEWNGSGDNFVLTTNAVYRDTSAWYHIQFTVDTTQATASNRVKMYVNGEQITSFSASTYPSQNLDTYYNGAYGHTISTWGTSANYFDGYLSEVHFIDGQALTPDYFGETDATYGHWKPIRYTGTYGTNGFYLPFSGTFYNDASGNGNNWTANNLATTDVVLDSPTNNFCTWNPLVKGTQTFAEGNLKCTIGDAFASPWRFGTQAMTTGKWYMEFIFVSGYGILGIAEESTNTNSAYGTTGSTTVRYNGDAYVDGTNSAGYLSSFGSTDVVQVAFDADTRKIWYGRNGTFVGDPAAGTGERGTITSTGSNVFLPAMGGYTGDVMLANFGQDSSFAGNKTAQNNTDDNGYGDFYYPVPSGFLSLCSANLSEPAVVPSENFTALLWAGNSSTQSIGGANFQADFTWTKSRNAAESHILMDRVRDGSATMNQQIKSDSTAQEAELPNSTTLTTTSTGFDLAGTGSGPINYNGYNYVTWLWKANNTSGSSNTDGSITSTVAANVDAGFSVVAWTANGNSSATVGHGLSQKPDIYIRKRRDSTSDWYVHTDLIDGTPDFLALNLTDAKQDGSALATSTTFPADTGSTAAHISYCFHSVDGYSKFGRYTGNGSSDGAFVYTGFRPAFVIIKRTNTAENWIVLDSARDPENASPDNILYPNLSNAEYSYSGSAYDFLSNGFKLRQSWSDFNGSGSTYIYMAFAEYDFKHSNGR